MIFTSALCVVLCLLSSTFAKQDKVEQLLEQISSSAAGEMAKVAKGFKGTDTKKLQDKLLDTEGKVLKKMEPQIIEVLKISKQKPDQIGKKIGEKINENKVLVAALPKSGKSALRGFPALALGVITVAVRAAVKVAPLVAAAVCLAPKIKEQFENGKN